MGTRCGPQYVDIQVVQLPGARAAYADNFSAISSAVQRALGAAGGPRNAVVLADSLSGCTQEYGLGETVMGATGERQGSANVHNRGGLTSILFSRDGAAAPGTARLGLVAGGLPARDDAQPRRRPVGRAAFDAAAPARATRRSSATAGRAPTSCATSRTPAPRTRCRPTAPRCPGAIPQNYDCGRDDYFNPAPRRGLLPGDALEHLRQRLPGALRRGRPGLRRRPAVGARAARRDRRARRSPAARAAARRSAPAPAAWSNSPTSYALPVAAPDRAPAGRTIDGATGATYVPNSEDLGRRLRVAVVATNEDGSASAASAPTAPIGAAGVNRAATTTSKQGQEARPRPRPRRPRRRRRRPRRSKSKAKKKAKAKKKVPSASRPQCRDGRVAARQAHPRVAGPAGPELHPHRRPDRRAHRRGGDGARAQPPRQLDRRRGRARTSPGWPATRSRSTSAARSPRPR